MAVDDLVFFQVCFQSGGALGRSPIGGLWPCGEGAGYAGGIMSAAADGLKTAEQILKHAPSRTASRPRQGE